MKLQPSDKQLEYLQSIETRPRRSPSVPPRARAKKTALPTHPPRSKCWKWIIALGIGLLLLFAADRVFSQTQPTVELASTSPVSMVDSLIIVVVVLILLFVARVVFDMLLMRQLGYIVYRFSMAFWPDRLVESEQSLCPSGKNNGSAHVTPVKRIRIENLPSPKQLLQTLSTLGKEIDLIENPPFAPTWPWSIGFSSTTGHVRSENQDYGICFRLNDLDILVVADGLGGSPHGQRAAYLAVREAAILFIRDLGSTPHPRTSRVQKILKRAMKCAHHALTVSGDKLGIVDINGGLRSTLLLAIGREDQVDYAYIGDGGMYILQTNGSLKNLMIPQKHEGYQNVLSASLGPERQGEPVFAHTARREGDLLILCSDGIADRVDSSVFARDIMRKAIQFGGDLQRTSDHIVIELTEIKDELGYICDDNITLAVAGTGHAPILSTGFWSNPQPLSSSDDPNTTSTALETELKIKSTEDR